MKCDQASHRPTHLKPSLSLFAAALALSLTFGAFGQAEVADSPSLAPSPDVASALAAAGPDLQPVDSGSPEAEAEEARVTLYATSWCGWCRKTRSLLTELQVEFREVDVEKDAKGREEFRSKTGGRSGVPVLDIAGTIVRGYDERRIRRLVRDLQDSA